MQRVSVKFIGWYVYLLQFHDENLLRFWKKQIIDQNPDMDHADLPEVDECMKKGESFAKLMEKYKQHVLLAEPNDTYTVDYYHACRSVPTSRQQIDNTIERQRVRADELLRQSSVYEERILSESSSNVDWAEKQMQIAKDEEQALFEAQMQNQREMIQAIREVFKDEWNGEMSPEVSAPAEAPKEAEVPAEPPKEAEVPADLSVETPCCSKDA